MLELLYQALASEHGIKVETDNVIALQQKLYAERRKAQDPDLDILSLVPSPSTPNQLWILKRGTAEGKRSSDKGDT